MKNDKWGRSSSSSDLTEDPTYVSVRFSRGLELLKGLEIQKAQQIFYDIIENEPSFAPAHYGLGYIYLHNDMKDRAIEEWIRSVNLDPSYGDAHYALAWAYYEREDIERGYQHVNKAIQSGVVFEAVKELIDIMLGTIVPVPVPNKDDGIIDEKKDEISIKDIIQDDHEVDRVSDTEQKDLRSFITFIQQRFIDYRSNTPVFLFSIAFIFRLFTLLVYFPVDFEQDSYHHWQIAYYTLKIGFSQGRMWDLSGMEYTWGIIPQLTKALLMGILRNSSLLSYRLLNAILGSLSVVLVYIIGVDYFDNKIGFYTALITTFFPTLVVMNITGRAETMALFFVLMAFYMYKRRPYGSGILLVLSGLCRSEFWFMTFVFVLDYLIFERDVDKFLHVFLGWLTVTVPTLIFYQMHTGVFYYPFQLYIQRATGVSSNSISNIFSDPWRIFYLSTLIIGIITTIYMIKKKTDKHEFYYFFLSCTVTFWGIKSGILGSNVTALGFTGLPFIYLRYFGMWLIFSFFLLTIFVFSNYRVNKFHPNILAIFIVVIFFFYSVPRAYSNIIQETNLFIEAADFAMEFYEGGTIVCDLPVMNYIFINKYKISHENVISNHYTPLYYNIQNVTRVKNWYKDRNATLFVRARTNTADSSRVYNFISSQDVFFFILQGTTGDNTKVYEINYSEQ